LRAFFLLASFDGVAQRFLERTTSLILGASLNAAILGALGLTHAFWVALLLLVTWALVFAAEMPIRQAYLNDMIPSRQRATVLSFETSMGSIGGVAIQPALGKVADTYSYGASLVVGGAIQLIAAPFLYLSLREHAAADTATSATGPPPAPPAAAETGPSGA
jgi:MFS family permease